MMTKSANMIWATLTPKQIRAYNSHGYDALKMLEYMAAHDDIRLHGLKSLKCSGCQRALAGPMATVRDNGPIEPIYTAALLHAGADMSSPCMGGLGVDIVGVHFER